MYNFQIVSGAFKERDIKKGLKLRPTFDQAIEEDVEDPMWQQVYSNLRNIKTY